MERILILNDLHVGSNFGLSPEHYAHNAYQKWALGYWKYLVKEFSHTINSIMLLGDLVDGPAQKDSTWLWSSDVNNQIEHAKGFIRMWIPEGKNINIYGVSGSGYHRGKGTGFDADQFITEELGGTHHKIKFKIRTPNGDILFHHQSKTITTEITRLLEENATTDGPRIRRLIGGHLHRYEGIEKFGIKITHAPCWQYPTDFMGAIPPIVTIGVIILEINDYGHHIQELDTFIPSSIKDQMGGFLDLCTEEQKKLEEKRREEFIKDLSESIPGIHQTQVKKVIEEIEKREFSDIKIKGM